MKWVVRILAALAGLLLLAVVTIYAMGHRSGAGHIHASAEIQATPGQLWPWINDGDRLKQWVSWLVEVKSDGSKRTLVMKDENNGGMLMQIDGAITESMPPRKLALKLSAMGEFEGDQSYQLTDLGNGRTRIEVNNSYHLNNAFANFMEPLITTAAQKKMDSDVASLKRAVEAAH